MITSFTTSVANNEETYLAIAHIRIFCGWTLDGRWKAGQNLLSVLRRSEFPSLEEVYDSEASSSCEETECSYDDRLFSVRCKKRRTLSSGCGTNEEENMFEGHYGGKRKVSKSIAKDLLVGRDEEMMNLFNALIDEESFESGDEDMLEFLHEADNENEEEEAQDDDSDDDWEPAISVGSVGRDRDGNESKDLFDSEDDAGSDHSDSSDCDDLYEHGNEEDNDGAVLSAYMKQYISADQNIAVKEGRVIEKQFSAAEEDLDKQDNLTRKLRRKNIQIQHLKKAMAHASRATGISRKKAEMKIREGYWLQKSKE